ncbi:hypothetical protein HAPAU_36100 [Halalkalicoccus paucihalophilus]|uniref:DUF368 domain-containing protein n=1 Tax=Halalkalicoccus paucihalophilus TaxID=1008153 RepID=A0A151AB87_9EURY|nr:DUF368 domain-containing protein [Halalkalicoccus paucihalophilus]KYH24627.1 hypothetical protein HAPAU_36100 [Halalkalicoccus paucihalophilus]
MTVSETVSTLRGSVPSVREWGRTFVIGLCMGSADAVPGVSGGTIALILGIYGRLIAMISAITLGRIQQLLSALIPFDDGIAIRKALGIWEDIDGWFGLALVAGVGTAIIVVTRLVHIANENSPTLLFGFFFGLIAASAIVLLRELSITTGFQAAAAALGFVVAFFLSGPVEFLEGESLLIVFFAGAVAVSAMILPGISGSLLLVILGQYTRMSTTLSQFVDGVGQVVIGEPSGQLADYGIVVITFLLGGLIGLFTISRIIRRSLDWNRQATMAFLIALVVGALRAPVEEVHTAVGFSTNVVVAFAGAAVVGAIVLLTLDWYAVELDLDSI